MSLDYFDLSRIDNPSFSFSGKPSRDPYVMVETSAKTSLPTTETSSTKRRAQRQPLKAPSLSRRIALFDAIHGIKSRRHVTFDAYHTLQVRRPRTYKPNAIGSDKNRCSYYCCPRPGGKYARLAVDARFWESTANPMTQKPLHPVKTAIIGKPMTEEKKQCHATGDWTISAPTHFVEVDNGDSWQSHDDTRCVYVSSLKVSDGHSVVPAASLRATISKKLAPPTEVERYTFEDSGLVSEAQVSSYDDGGHELKGFSCVDSYLATCMLSFQRPEHRGWAKKTWQSLRHLSVTAKSRPR
jgi:hypothetical protein